MPHISKKSVKKDTKKEIEENLFTILMNTTSYSRGKIFNELYTDTERVMFAKRLGILALIRRGIPSYTISKILAVSPSTVARFEIQVTQGKYRMTLHELNRIKISNRFIKFILDITMPPSRARRVSLTKLLEKI